MFREVNLDEVIQIVRELANGQPVQLWLAVGDEPWNAVFQGDASSASREAYWALAEAGRPAEVMVGPVSGRGEARLFRIDRDGRIWFMGGATVQGQLFIDYMVAAHRAVDGGNAEEADRIYREAVELFGEFPRFRCGHWASPRDQLAAKLDDEMWEWLRGKITASRCDECRERAMDFLTDVLEHSRLQPS
jgi:hypothetical protein